ncbi:uncharacterized protein EI90DRAFT_3031337 [Cantharellus anzutake]|uniref:uncharacterized protein n=1 Tax=Cantharellus anzutake TaxID=1750568 RepID=UPI0019034063|nr:uncharacterized protein EI90DRAFT_3031337 [Cantharellus anzutake]KAF8343093.1 hypothetical protein EI90DRAFT_3031337 [Cantharellus anzutake]
MFSLSLLNVSVPGRKLSSTLVILALIIAGWLLQHHLYITFCLAYTYYAFAFLPTAILGHGDGFDLLNMKSPPDALEIVPRILHRVHLGRTPMRPRWIAAHQSCLKLHGNWTINLWDEQSANIFMLQHYPHLYDPYRAFPRDMHRSVIIRYLVLNKQGGIFLDLGIKCNAPLHSFLTQEWLSLPGKPIGIDTAFVTSVPDHPFLHFIIDKAFEYHLSYISAYGSKSSTAGSRLVSALHAQYPERLKLKVLPQEYKLGRYSIMSILEYLRTSTRHWGDTAAATGTAVSEAVEWFISPWLIFGIILGVFFVLGLFLVLMYVYVYRRRRNKAGLNSIHFGRSCRDNRY